MCEIVKLIELTQGKFAQVEFSMTLFSIVALRFAHWAIERYEPELALVPINITAPRQSPEILAEVTHSYQWRLNVMIFAMWADRAGKPTYSAMRAASGNRTSPFRRGWMQTTKFLREHRVMGQVDGATVWYIRPRIVSQWMRDDPDPLPFPDDVPLMYAATVERGTTRNAPPLNLQSFGIPERRTGGKYGHAD